MELVEENYYGIKNLNLMVDKEGFGYVEYYGLNIPMNNLYKFFAEERAGNSGRLGFPERVLGPDKITEKYPAMSEIRKTETRFNLKHPEWALETLQEVVEEEIQNCPYRLGLDAVGERSVVEVYKEKEVIGKFEAPNEGAYIAYFELGLLQEDLLDTIKSELKDTSDLFLLELREYLEKPQNEEMFKTRIALDIDRECNISLGEIYNSSSTIENGKLIVENKKSYKKPRVDSVENAKSERKSESFREKSGKKERTSR